MLRERVASIPEGYQSALPEDLLHAFRLESSEGLVVELLRFHMANYNRRNRGNEGRLLGGGWRESRREL